jgi:alpha-2-macroglobulin
MLARRWCSESRRYHVALVDPLPAGFEVQNEGLATTRDKSGSKGSGTMGKSRRYDYWWYQWYEFENKRDERVEAFTSLLWEGTYTYEYTTLATTPGTFIVPPTKVEEMYSPETFGRAASDKVFIEAAPNQL